MRRTLPLIFTLIGSVITALAASVAEHPVIMYIGMTIAGLVALLLISKLITAIWHYLTNTIVPISLVAAGLVTTGLLSYFKVLPPIWGFATGGILGITLYWLLMRRLAAKAHTSVILGELFSFVSNYKIRSYIQHKSIVERNNAVETTQDIKNLELILTEQMGYTKTQSKEAASHVKDSYPDAPMDEKVVKALSYLSVPNSLEGE